MCTYIASTDLFLALQVHIQGIAACSFGNDLTPLIPSSQTDGLIVNTANVAQCPTTWNMCYYSSTTDQSSTVYLGVYRSGNNQYTLVSRSPSNYTISKPQTSSTYSCINFSIPQSQQFMVQMGDVIAACVQPSGSGRLGILAISAPTNIPLMTSIACGPLSSPLPSPIMGPGFTTRSIALHISLGMSYS